MVHVPSPLGIVLPLLHGSGMLSLPGVHSIELFQGGRLGLGQGVSLGFVGLNWGLDGQVHVFLWDVHILVIHLDIAGLKGWAHLWHFSHAVSVPGDILAHSVDFIPHALNRLVGDLSEVVWASDDSLMRSICVRSWLLVFSVAGNSSITSIGVIVL